MVAQASAGKGSPHDSAWIMILRACVSLNLSKASQFGSALADGCPFRRLLAGSHLLQELYRLTTPRREPERRPCCWKSGGKTQNIPVRGRLRGHRPLFLQRLRYATWAFAGLLRLKRRWSVCKCSPRYPEQEYFAHSSEKNDNMSSKPALLHSSPYVKDMIKKRIAA